MNSLDDFIPLIKDTLAQDKQFILPVYGQSMEPLLHSKDSVVLEKPENLKKNDMILYQRTDGSYVFHRIFRLKKNGYSLLGDHQIKEEFPILKEQVIAKAIGYHKKKKHYNVTHFTYRVYVFIWRCKFIRRVYFKLFGGKRK